MHLYSVKESSMKHWLLTLLIVLPGLCMAHGGGLNSEGCHTKKKTGEYHCHQSTSKAFNRDDYGFKSYKTTTNIGFYTQKECEIHIDHVVSLKDAHESGASVWSNELKRRFANDRENHVPSCARVNMSKSASTPSDFLRKSHDKRSFDYEIQNFCEYISIYFFIKEKYNLSAQNNDMSLLHGCQ